MDIQNPWSALSISLSLIGIAWALIAQFNRRKYRKPQAGLSKTQNTVILFAPLLLAVVCVLFLSYVPGTTPMLPVYGLGITFCLSGPFLGISAEWIGVPLAIRQAATQVVWGVLIGFAFLILVSAINDILT